MNHLSKITLENIRYQVDYSYFNAVCDAFKIMRELYLIKGKGPSLKTLVNESGIEDVVQKHTNINIRFTTSTVYGYNAYVIPPDLDRNHPLLAGRNPEYFARSTDAKRHLKKSKNDIISGTVDIKEGKVYGVFTEVESEVFVATQLITDDKFTIEEVASIFLHEIGHVMTYMLYLGRSVIANHVMGELALAINDAETERERVEIIELASKKLGVEVMEPDAVAKAKGPEISQTVILSQYQSQICSATNTIYHDERTWEALADQYVSRVGGAVSLATGLDKIMRMYGDPSYRSTFKHIIIETASFMLSVVGTFGVLPLLLVMIAPFTRSTELYDNVPKRLERIRADIVNQLKKEKIPDELRKRLLEEADTIKKMMSEVSDRSDWIEGLFSIFSPQTRLGKRRAQVIQELEQLTNNDLYVMAQKLTQNA